MTRLSRRRLLIWLGLPVIVTLGIGGGYLAASWATDDAAPPAATAAHNHAGHVMPDGQTMPDGAAMSTAPSTPAAHNHGGHVMPDGTSMSGSDAMPTPSASMSGMDMSGGDMAGMDTGGHAGNGGHGASGHGSDTPASRPRAAVLGTFGLFNGGILVAAFTLRRRSRTRRRPATR